MSSWRKTDDKAGAIVTMWRPLTDEDGVPLDEDRDERESEAVPQWCMAAGCLQPLGSRYYEVRTIGHDRAACGPPGPGGPRSGSGQEHTWSIRRVYVCPACYTSGLEREVGAGWTRTGEWAGGPPTHARRTGGRQGDWDD